MPHWQYALCKASPNVVMFFEHFKPRPHIRQPESATVIVLPMIRVGTEFERKPGRPAASFAARDADSQRPA